jgi:adenylate kinase family enzyme
VTRIEIRDLDAAGARDTYGGTLNLMEEPAGAIGRRVLVDGMAGSGKSTFSRSLSARTGLPVIHLDVHYWKPGWVKPSEDAWRETQRSLLAGDAWIVDGNDLQTLELRLARADTVVLLETPWWTCAFRAFLRGLRKPVGEMPEGCEDSAWRRLRDEWRLVGVILRNRRSEPERARAIVAEHGRHAALHALGSKRAAREFLDGLAGGQC